MAYINSLSQVNEIELIQNSLKLALATFYGRILQLMSRNATLLQTKIESLSKSQFKVSGSSYENTTADNSPLFLQIQELPKNREFDFIHEMTEINQNESVKDKEVELASRFCKIVNPHNIPDGHCASCAFNTHLHLLGEKLEEGRDPSKNFKEFGDWFYQKVKNKFDDNIVESSPDETYSSMRERVEQKVKELTQAGQSVLISISDGTHWYNAYNDGTRVWFIDSQTGIGFNLYDGKNVESDDIINEPQTVNIIQLEPEVISEYNKAFRT